MTDDLLGWVKARTWFYEFPLPDRSTTRTDVPPAVLAIHQTRERHLERFIRERIGDARNLDALDLASHEGYFSLILSRHFRRVTGVEQRTDSIEAATNIARLLGLANVDFRHARIESLDPRELQRDLVLMYGLLYHVQDPIGMLQQAARLARRFLCIETQVLPFNVVGNVEDGHHLAVRTIHGLFGVVEDYPEGREGGVTSFAMVPSVEGLVWLLRKLGFSDVRIAKAEAGDYEQYLRGHRVMIFATR